MNHRHLLKLASLFALLAALVAPGASGVTDSRPAPQAPAPPVPAASAPSEPQPDASDDERTMARELRRLARAWADGGGTFGYPFWEKAAHRWRTGGITTAMYREYVTGYRDRLVVGCELLDQAETSDQTAREARDLLLDSCERRVDALRATQRSLDEQLRRDGDDPDGDAAAVEERIARHDQEAREAMQESWRDARLAMDLAQRALDDAGLDRLDEDAFI